MIIYILQLRHELNQLSDDKAKFSKTKFTSAKLKKRKEKVVTDPWSMTKNVQFSLPPIHNLGKVITKKAESLMISLCNCSYQIFNFISIHLKLSALIKAQTAGRLVIFNSRHVCYGYCPVYLLVIKDITLFPPFRLIFSQRDRLRW